MKNNKQILNKTYKLIETGWTKINTATNKWHVPVDIFSDEAHHFCLFGAVKRAVGKSRSKDVPVILDLLRINISKVKKFHSDSIINFNDDPDTNKKDILKLIEITRNSIENENS